MIMNNIMIMIMNMNNISLFGAYLFDTPKLSRILTAAVLTVSFKISRGYLGTENASVQFLYSHSANIDLKMV